MGVIRSVKTDVLKQFGKRVKDLRQAKGISQEELAELSGFHRNYIGMLERGERNISLKNITVIAKTFKMSVRDLFDY
jgi:transcriptional regulator with XRE-family HTH domain